MILISPWARNTTEGKPSPKNYPHWADLVALLRDVDSQIVQMMCEGEAKVPGVGTFVVGHPLKDIVALMKEERCKTWISVDNFFHHLAWSVGKPGVVLWGMSDPEIFGHPENVNLLKDRSFLRKRQFGLWSQELENPKAFVSPEEVVQCLKKVVAG